MWLSLYEPLLLFLVSLEEKITTKEDVSAVDQSNTSFPEWACQRKAKLEHLNIKLTSAIEVLQEHAELRDGNQDYSRALAFRRASSVLKALQFPVQSVEQLRGLKDIGEHVKTVIADFLDHGSSSEVEEILKSHWFRKMKLFTSVFGVGPSTAKAWIDHGWENLEDAQKNGCPSNDWRIAWGLAFWKDLNTPVCRTEALTFSQIVQQEAESILPGVITTLVGGFRRGKQEGHDVDILLSHPKEGAETDLLPKLIAALGKRGLMLIGHKEKSSFRSDVLYQDFKISTRGQLDHFEKWLGICKFPKSFSKHENSTSKCEENQNNSHSKTNSDSNLKAYASLDDSLSELYEPKAKKAKPSETTSLDPNLISAAPRDWLARRVDLIIAPYSQYYYALVGWTGSKHFNRDARLYAQKKLGLKLTSHGLYDLQKRESLSAQSEEEVFAHLNLQYVDPSDRNC
ncbi:DNA polymerase mu [Elysia marginata]|uniref:DNA-directed DNA polymerase n=1 Tax=Elysia marginata TaxID=1093978 RepID=A0AAV4H9C3_9GAST|nr:DNA polymerase mu [Elysia marginata]